MIGERRSSPSPESSLESSELENESFPPQAAEGISLEPIPYSELSQATTEPAAVTPTAPPPTAPQYSSAVQAAVSLLGHAQLALIKLLIRFVCAQFLKLAVNINRERESV